MSYAVNAVVDLILQQRHGSASAAQPKEDYLLLLWNYSIIMRYEKLKLKAIENIPICFCSWIWTKIVQLLARVGGLLYVYLVLVSSSSHITKCKILESHLMAHKLTFSLLWIQSCFQFLYSHSLCLLWSILFEIRRHFDPTAEGFGAWMLSWA